MELIDSHCHLTFRGLVEDLPGVVERARAAGVGRMITVGTDLADTRAALEAARQHDGVYVTAGIHPHEAAKVGPDDLQELARLLEDPNVVAVGECGLDFHYDFSDRPSQRKVFREQLELALASGLPVVIHSREAFGETVETLVSAGLDGRKVVFHCFSGGPDEASTISEHGWGVSLTGIVTFKNAKELQTAARQLPDEQLMVETDAPYLSPVPVRNERPCEPAFLVHTVRFLAELRDQEAEAVARHCTANTVEFFGLR